MLGVLEYLNPTSQTAARRVARRFAVVEVAQALGRPRAEVLFKELFPGPKPDNEEFIPPP